MIACYAILMPPSLARESEVLVVAAIVLAVILILIVWAVRAPYGYEDDNGWHADPEPYLSEEVRRALHPDAGPTHDYPSRDSSR